MEEFKDILSGTYYFSVPNYDGTFVRCSVAVSVIAQTARVTELFCVILSVIIAQGISYGLLKRMSELISLRALLKQKTIGITKID